MSTLKTYPMNNSAILRINAERDSIKIDPEYQRHGDIWTLEKKQLLIDSILNDYDIPKLYFHLLPKPHKAQSGKEYIYSIIDGRQRLETIWSFIDGMFALADDFKFFKDHSVKASNLTYGDLAKKYPKLKINLDSYNLPIILVDTDDIELIEDMFSRLNEAVPLNAAEKRNAIGGPMATLIKNISSHDFFKANVRFSNKRYQHREIAARLLFLDFLLEEGGKKIVIDTKKVYLDDFVRRFKKNNQLNSQEIGGRVRTILNEMHRIFTTKDDLLRAQSIVPIIYLLFREAIKQSKLDIISRKKLVDFRRDIDNNRAVAEQDITKANFEYLEFDRMSQQGTNDAASIKERVRIIGEYFGIKSSL